MMAKHPLKLSALAAALLAAAPALAQSSLPTVTIAGRNADAPVLIGGWGDTPVAKLPLQASVLNSERLLDAGVSNLAGLAQLDASVGDAYNSAGYVSYLKIRGFDLDNRFNYRRDGLPISAETALALGNKASIEVLKGTSGTQAGTSAPGGLVNLVVKRPDVKLLALSAGVSERGTLEAAVDWSQRFGSANAFGLRINAAGATLRPQLKDAEGERQLLSLAGDWRLNPDTLLEAELEWSRQSQPSQPGMSLLGSTLPDAKTFDPRRNLNNLAWSQPVAFDNSHASLRWQQRLSAHWHAQAHLGLQELKTDDRLAYAYGCSAENAWDRYCSNGDFDRYDFRSENERRRTQALDLSLSGKLAMAGLQHQINAGLLLSRYQAHLGPQTYQWSGVGNVFVDQPTPPNAEPNDVNTNREERSHELYLRDAVQIDKQWQAWLGLRHSRVERESVRTDGSRATDYSQSFSTPWLGLSYAITPMLMAYGSWGEGVESEVPPNRSRYSNRGQVLPALKSRQFELGLKSGSSTVDWSVNAFDIRRPVWGDIGACDDNAGSCTRKADGYARHRGLEAQADIKWGGGGLLASAMKLKARREAALESSMNGLKPANVAETSLKLNARQRLTWLPALQLNAALIYEGPRTVLPDASLSIPGWTRLDAGLRYEQTSSKQLLVWRVGVDNLGDKRAWRESPFQYGHAYLYPLAPRTWRASVEVQL